VPWYTQDKKLSKAIQSSNKLDRTVMVKMSVKFNVLRYYLLSWKVGISALRSFHINREIVERLIIPLPYMRQIEIREALNALDVRPGEKVLDLGSPKFAGLYLASTSACRMHLTDISDHFREDYNRFAKFAGSAGQHILIETVDGRSLPYLDGSFDKVFSISVIEHISAEGDKLAVKEMERVLKPGGLMCLTFPFRSGYAEAYTDEDVYGLYRGKSGPYFFSRYYNIAAIQDRILAQLNATSLVAFRVINERVPVYFFLTWLPRFARRAIRPADWLYSFVLGKVNFGITECSLQGTIAGEPGQCPVVFRGYTSADVEHQASPFSVCLMLLRKERQ
jgi:ubiquinone/menaquinone biosynthesis C-methylase UbiE